MDGKEIESCIQTINLLKELAYNIHGIMDVIDARNLQAIIDLLKQQEPMEPEIEGGGPTYWEVCGECHGTLGSMDKYCRHCGRPIKRKK